MGGPDNLLKGVGWMPHYSFKILPKKANLPSTEETNPIQQTLAGLCTLFPVCLNASQSQLSHCLPIRQEGSWTFFHRAETKSDYAVPPQRKSVADVNLNQSSSALVQPLDYFSGCSRGSEGLIDLQLCRTQAETFGAEKPASAINTLEKEERCRKTNACSFPDAGSVGMTTAFC